MDVVDRKHVYKAKIVRLFKNNVGTYLYCSYHFKVYRMNTEDCQAANSEGLFTKSLPIKTEQIIVRSLRKIKYFLFIRYIKGIFGMKYYSGSPKVTSGQRLPKEQDNKPKISSIVEGNIVRIRSREEILATLNERNKLEGCFFMQEMFNYCGKEYKVIKKVENFFDEATMEMKKARATFLLEGLHCSGKLTGYVTKCDRNCYSFWKEAWLEKVE